MKDLNELRREIDGIDRELVKLFEKRMEVSAQIGAYKASRGMPVLDAAREEEKLRLCGAAVPRHFHHQPQRTEPGHCRSDITLRR